MEDLLEAYSSLDHTYETLGDEAIDSSCLLAFDYEYPQQECEILMDSDEFTAVCPWTGLPDFGTLTVRYVPYRKLLELKSFKYYLLSYRQVGIVQEHAANRILQDIVEVCQPRRVVLTLDFKTRGGIHTVVEVSHTALEM
ncbi:NADPH-dependent 7-cyano-7-deazaguanine reductase QueF [SAR202 cluster bacterium AC-647-N09_OGT_505m]|nr:NADPH-dependent 7-cyano-7-deazaguanine reductase QueF [SAR202 cluster bacterium AC-647-N09_OGT_505m]